jgi:hypothetical protein
MLIIVTLKVLRFVQFKNQVIMITDFTNEQTAVSSASESNPCLVNFFAFTLMHSAHLLVFFNTMGIPQAKIK